MKNLPKFLFLGVALTQLAACQTSGSSEKMDTQSPATQSEKIDAAIDRAMVEASGNELTATLITLERQYKRNSSDPTHAYNYARALRQADYANRASLVLSPFAKGANPDAKILSEMSSIDLALGKFGSAENFAQQAVLKNPQDHLAFQNLGIALEAQENHAAAERAFRKGLETWKGDPTPIMNNLALNLATQGFVEEAIQILEKAKALSPERMEIERNLRIVRALNER